jgi:hypothetical protein
MPLLGRHLGQHACRPRIDAATASIWPMPFGYSSCSMMIHSVPPTLRTALVRPVQSVRSWPMMRVPLVPLANLAL